MSAQEYDDVTRPSHYCHGGFEAKDVVVALLRDACDDGAVDGPEAWWYGNALKYLMRWPFKADDDEGRLRDLAKARECVDRLAALVEGEDRELDRLMGEMGGAL